MIAEHALNAPGGRIPPHILHYSENVGSSLQNGSALQKQADRMPVPGVWFAMDHAVLASIALHME